MKNLSCDIIADLLPLYADEKCSEYTKKCIIHHTDSCDECKNTLSEMNVNIVTNSDASNLSDARKIDDMIMTGFMKKFLFIACTVMLEINIIVGILFGMLSNGSLMFLFGIFCYNSITLCVTMYYSFVSKYRVLFILAALAIIHVIIPACLGILSFNSIYALCFSPPILGTIAGKIAKR